MNDDPTFLRAIMVSPADASNRRVYADWLEERGDPRAQFLRIDADFDQINYVDWLERDGSIDYYVENFPEIGRLAEERRSVEPARKELENLGSGIDREWVSFMRTLGRPFRRFFFFNNHGEPRECQPDELPFNEPIGIRGAVITFATAFTDDGAWDSDLMSDLRFLCELELTDCEYGAARCPVHPFICEFTTKHEAITGADVLAALKPRNFRSEHIDNLNATEIPYPGYNPGTENDEIHNDFSGQYIFAKGDDEDDESEEQIDESSGAHGALKQFVKGDQLWYVLLHTTPEQVEEFQFSRYAILLAVGRSSNGRRLIGVIAHQVCHNLCD